MKFFKIFQRKVVYRGPRVFYETFLGGLSVPDHFVIQYDLPKKFSKISFVGKSAGVLSYYHKIRFPPGLGSVFILIGCW